MKLWRPFGAALVSVAIALTTAWPAPRDEIRDAQWHLNFLRVRMAHELSLGEGTAVAVVDTGADADHPDLRGRVLPGIDLTESGGGGKGDTDEDGHGTAMAGLIAANGRALGIAPGARIVPVRDKTLGIGFESALAAGIDW